MLKGQRNSEILSLRKKGKSLTDIAAQFNLSRGRVRQIIVDYESLERRREALQRRYGAHPIIATLPDDTPIDVLIFCNATIRNWGARVRGLQYASIQLRTLGELRGTNAPTLLREPRIGPKMLAQLRAYCPFRRRKKC
jgi:Sigma-70, region 4